MTYDIRLFSKSVAAISILHLQSLFEDCRFEVLEGEDAKWRELLVTSNRGDEICLVERANAAAMSKEVDWLRSDLHDRRPRASAQWAATYLGAARVLYGCQYLSFGLSPKYAQIPSRVMWALQTISGGGIVHAEGQGFSNEDGYQITWEFSDRVSGTRQVAVLGASGRWETFELDMSDERHRIAFRVGERPVGADILELN